MVIWDHRLSASRVEELAARVPDFPATRSCYEQLAADADVAARFSASILGVERYAFGPQR